MASSHQFVEKTFTKLTYCDYCTKLLWGVAHQGMTCEGCGFNCHHKCAKLVYNNCIRSMYVPGQDDNKKKKGSRRAATGDTSGTIPAAIVSSSQPLQTVPNRSLSTPLTIQTPTSSSLPPQDEKPAPPAPAPAPEQPASLGFLEDAIISAAIRMTFPSDLSSLPKSNHPPLTIQATTINFTRFVHRTSGLFWFQDRVEDILTWKDPWNTTFVLVIYCFVCIYPMLLFLLPQCIVATIAIYFFQQKSMKQQQRILQVRGTNASATDDTASGRQPSTDHSQARHDDDHHVIDHGELDSATSSESDEEQQEERRSMAVQYMSNLQHIQNMMGDISDAHDQLRPLLKHLDWSDETETVLIVQGCMAAFVGMGVAMWFIPWRQVFLVGGVSGMLANSPWGKIILRELTPVGQEVAVWARTQLAKRK